MQLEFSYTEKIEQALEIVQIAADELRKISKKDMKIDYKNNDLQDIVTNKDIMTENRIVEFLSMVYPEDGFITEETTKDDVTKDGVWILDPIDGTTNFAYSLKDYAISLAYYYKKEPVFGIVCDVSRNLTYLGIKGRGAYLNEEPLDKIVEMPFDHSIFDMSLRSVFIFKENFGINFEKLVMEATAFRSIGSAALGIAHIASGDIHFYGSNSLKLWDYAAARVILEEVGGYISISEDNGDFGMSHTIMASTSFNSIEKFKNYK
jgi:myo-inositol-1(or 4)-monophosphatase